MAVFIVAVELRVSRPAGSRAATAVSSLSAVARWLGWLLALAARAVAARTDLDSAGAVFGLSAIARAAAGSGARPAARMDVFWEGRPVGQAIPFIVGRHVHHQVPQAQSPGPPPPPASITWGWCWPSMTSTSWARLPTAICRAPRTRVTRAPWVSHFGFTRTPFSKTIPASQLCDRASHQEAVARIRFCIGESLLGVITGEVGVGKTVALRVPPAGVLEARHAHLLAAADERQAHGATSPGPSSSRLMTMFMRQ